MDAVGEAVVALDVFVEALADPLAGRLLDLWGVGQVVCGHQNYYC